MHLVDEKYVLRGFFEAIVFFTQLPVIFRDDEDDEDGWTGKNDVKVERRSGE